MSRYASASTWAPSNGTAPEVRRFAESHRSREFVAITARGHVATHLMDDGDEVAKVVGKGESSLHLSVDHARVIYEQLGELLAEQKAEAA